MTIAQINTLGKLKKSGYIHKSVKEEIRQNLIKKLGQEKVSGCKKTQKWPLYRVHIHNWLKSKDRIPESPWLLNGKGSQGV